MPVVLGEKNMHQQNITKDFAICDVLFTPESFNKTLRVESKTHIPCQPNSISLESASVHSGQSNASCAKHALVGRHLGKSLSGMKLNDGFTRLCQQKKIGDTTQQNKKEKNNEISTRASFAPCHTILIYKTMPETWVASLDINRHPVNKQPNLKGMAQNLFKAHESISKHSQCNQMSSVLYLGKNVP